MQVSAPKNGVYSAPSRYSVGAGAKILCSAVTQGPSGEERAGSIQKSPSHRHVSSSPWTRRSRRTPRLRETLTALRRQAAGRSSGAQRASWREYETGRMTGESVYCAAVPEGARVCGLVPEARGSLPRRSRGHRHSVSRDIFINRVAVGKCESARGGVRGLSSGWGLQAVSVHRTLLTAKGGCQP